MKLRIGALMYVLGTLPLWADHYTTEHGLSQNSVIAIATDARGFLWLGTEDGLNCFDGYGFKVYRSEPQRPGLSDSFVQRLGRHGEVLWIGTVGGGLSRMDLRRERIVALRDALAGHELAEKTVEALAVEDEGRIWVVVGSQLWRLDWDGVEPAEARLAWQPGSERSVGTLARSVAGDLVLGGEGVLCRYSPESGDCAPILLDGRTAAGRSIRALAFDRADALWVAVHGEAVYRLDFRTADERRWRMGSELPAAITRVLAIAPSTGGLWLGTDYGAWQLRTDCVCPAQRIDRLVYDGQARRLVYALEPGADDALWLGYWNLGLERFDPKRSGMFGFRPHLGGNPTVYAGNVRGFAFGFDRLWLASYGHGVIEARTAADGAYLYRQPELLRPKTAAESLVWTVASDPDGALWIGSDEGLLRVDWTRNRRQSIGLINGQPLRAVRALLFDRRDRLWIGAERGLYWLDRKQPGRGAHPVTRGDGRPLPDRRVFALHQDRAGALWIGTWFGVYALDDGDGTPSLGDPLAPELGLRLVWDIADAHDGGLWIGSSDGLVHIAVDGRHRRYTEADGLANRVIYGVEPDSFGALWLSSNRGLMRFDPQTERVVNYSRSDGLVQNEFLFGGHARDPEGRLWFGGMTGFQRVEPAMLHPSTSEPEPVLTAIRVDGRELEVGDPRLPLAPPVLQHLRLLAGDRVLEVHYTGIAFDQARDLRFRYRLEGYDQDWQYAQDRRFALYTGLPPGRYRFVVHVLGRAGESRGAARVLDIDVQAHLWQRREMWWIGTLLLLTGIGVLVWWRLSELGARRLALERIVAERTRELAEQGDALRRANAELATLSTRDPLTGLANRRALLTQFGHDLATARAKQQPLSIALIDIDHFKRINDTLGHAMGDRVLAALGPLWVPVLPPGALLGRYGGEEFLLLLPGFGAAAASELIAQLLERLRRTRMDPQHADWVVTCSAGVAAWHGPPESVEQLIQRADEALYRAKRAGRDCFELTP